jgi:hypothetical protein
VDQPRALELPAFGVLGGDGDVGGGVPPQRGIGRRPLRHDDRLKAADPHDGRRRVGEARPRVVAREARVAGTHQIGAGRQRLRHVRQGAHVAGDPVREG